MEVPLRRMSRCRRQAWSASTRPPAGPRHAPGPDPLALGSRPLLCEDLRGRAQIQRMTQPPGV